MPRASQPISLTLMLSLKADSAVIAKHTTAAITRMRFALMAEKYPDQAIYTPSGSGAARRNSNMSVARYRLWVDGCWGDLPTTIDSLRPQNPS